MQSIMYRLHFLFRFISSPKKIGSITPSSRYLVKTLLQPIPWDQIETIVELGAGTGAVTQEIERKMNASCQAVIFESDPQLTRVLRRNHPRVFHCWDAKDLTQELYRIGIDQVDCIVSCLPFANFSEQDRSTILDEIVKALSPDGIFVAYQYSLQMKSALQARFANVEIQFVPINLPPAFVYICR
jgi:phospholipid N-methyltransferase